MYVEKYFRFFDFFATPRDFGSGLGTLKKKVTVKRKK